MIPSVKAAELRLAVDARRTSPHTLVGNGAARFPLRRTWFWLNVSVPDVRRALPARN